MIALLLSSEACQSEQSEVTKNRLTPTDPIPVNTKKAFYLVLLLLGTFSLARAGNELKATSETQPDEDGPYYHYKFPSTEEWADFKRFAVAHGSKLDWDSAPKDFSELPDFFRLASKFETFDRRAEIYGYHLFSCVFMLISYAGNPTDKAKMEAEFAKHIDAQPSEVRQRVRDFLYYGFYNADPKVMAANDRAMRTSFKLLFPSTYSFGEDDPVFRPFSVKK